MDINKLIANIKKKIENNVPLEYIKIEDKSFIHKNHPGNKEGKCHLKIFIKSSKLKKISKIDSNKIIYKLLDNELKKSIHSLQIFID